MLQEIIVISSDSEDEASSFTRQQPLTNKDGFLIRDLTTAGVVKPPPATTVVHVQSLAADEGAPIILSESDDDKVV